MPETAAATTAEDTASVTAEAEKSAADALLSGTVDFKKLQKTNPDVYAWIEVPGTVISYPVLQSADDNAFYTKHRWDGSYYAGGAIFTEDYNSKDFTDRNTVIYGHYMNNGTLFAGLHSFIDADFFAENRYVYIYTPDKTLTYKIFAVYPYDTRHLLLSFDYSNPFIFGKVFESVFKIRDMSAQISDDVTLDSENDLVLTLSTCFYGDGEKRFLLQAVLVTDELS